MINGTACLCNAATRLAVDDVLQPRLVAFVGGHTDILNSKIQCGHRELS
jgi:hypothetical protein